jgi:hypothetical protein
LAISTHSGLVQQLVQSVTHTFNAQTSPHTSTRFGKDLPGIGAPSQGISLPSQRDSHPSTAHIQSLCKDFESLSVGSTVYPLKEHVAQDQNLKQDPTINSPRPVRAQRLTCLDRWTEIEEARSQSRSLSWYMHVHCADKALTGYADEPLIVDVSQLEHLAHVDTADAVEYYDDDDYFPLSPGLDPMFLDPRTSSSPT